MRSRRRAPAVIQAPNVSDEEPTGPPKWLRPLLDPVLYWLDNIGTLVTLTLRTVVWLFRPPFRVSRMLAAMGCRVASAEHGLRALEIMESGVFDLVLLDGQMPVMPGDQVAQVIRDPKSAVRNHDVAILCVTADVVSERLQHYLASGMDAVLTKPFRKSGLRQAVVDVVRRVGRP